MKAYYIIMALSNCEEISEERLERFIKYNESNPEVWGLFQKVAKTQLRRNKRFSGMDIFVIIRHEEKIEEGQDGFKANNNFSGMYSRLLAATNPDFVNYFRHRKIKRQTMDVVYDRESETVHTI